MAVAPPKKSKIVYIPEESVGTYRWQEDVLRIDHISDLKAYHIKKRRFIPSAVGRKFLKYRKKKLTTLHGLTVWLVDGDALRSGLKAGDVDFTMGGHGYRYLYIPRYEIWIDEVHKGTPDVWPVIWHEYIERILMRNGMPYAQAHEIASRLEIVHREGTYFVLPVGTYRQSTPWTCGPAAMKIVLDYLRWPLSENYLVKLCRTTPSKGADPADIVRAAEKLGFEAYDEEKMTVPRIKKLIRNGTPIIANFQFKPKLGEGHYAVIIGFSRDEFILSDPAENKGYRRVKIKEFLKQWYELEDKTVRQGIIIGNY